MTPRSQKRDGSAQSPMYAPNARLHVTKPPMVHKAKRARALCAVVGLAGSSLLPQSAASASGLGLFAPGSVVVSQGGTIFGGTNTGAGVELNGDVDVYRSNANGDVAPEASFTNGMYGPTTMVFDQSGDLWVGNENTSDLFEFTKAQLGTPNPVPAVTIFAESGALANPFGMAFDDSGNLWVVGNNSNRVYEYAKSQLAMSGGPTPHTTISDFPSTPIFGVAFDSSGDLWVSTVKSVVEFSKAELAKAKPEPTVTVSSSGGANSSSISLETCGWSPAAVRTALALPVPTRWWSSPRPSSRHRDPLRLPSRSVQRTMAPLGHCTAPTRSHSTPPVTCGLRTSTTTPRSSLVGTSSLIRAHPPRFGQLLGHGLG